MAHKPETKFKHRILPILKKLPNSYIDKIQQKAKRGTLDLILCINGLYVTLELKKGIHDGLDPLQSYNVKRVRSANGISFECTPENFPSILAYLKVLSRHVYEIPEPPEELL